MPVKKALAERKGVCAIVFRKRSGKSEFLLLHRVLHWQGWEFVKGGLKKGEKPLNTLKRELKEEINLMHFEKIKKISAMLSFWDSIRKKHSELQAFAVQIPPNAKVQLKQNHPREHSSFKWVSRQKALKSLTYESARKVFKTAYKTLK